METEILDILYGKILHTKNVLEIFTMILSGRKIWFWKSFFEIFILIY